jgi:HSP20 family protein
MATRWSDLDRAWTWMDDFRRQVDRLFDEYDAPAARGAEAGGPWPRAGLWDTGSGLLLVAEVPGLADKDVKVTVNQDVLTIEGERRAEAPQGYSVHRRERGAVTFARSVAFPCRVDVEKATATVKDGVLMVTLPKAAEAQPRQIAVRAQ